MRVKSNLTFWQKFSHDGHHRLQRGFSASQRLVEGPQATKAGMYRAPTQVTTTTTADPGFLFDGGSGREATWIESTECHPLASIQGVGQHG